MGEENSCTMDNLLEELASITKETPLLFEKAKKQFLKWLTPDKCKYITKAMQRQPFPESFLNRRGNHLHIEEQRGMGYA